MSSPVNTSGLATYTLESVLKDGTTALDATSEIGTIAKDITFINGYDGNFSGSPIQLAEYWIHTYSTGDGTRSNWVQKFKNGAIPQTDGFIFKGPGRVQNYTFVGSPKDGDISTPQNVGGYDTYLIGNPYASAININKFIEDNINSITGTLYFWEHQHSTIGEGNDIDGHMFSGYIGGYATRNRVMGLAANNPSNSSNDNNGTSGLGQGNYSAPKPYIAIGQGFFIGGDVDGGPITFNNSQREFITEGANSIFFKQKKKAGRIRNDNIGNSIPIIKLGFEYKNAENLPIHRQAGISFHEENSFAYEKGIDSKIYDLGETDIYWEFDNDNNKYIIAGVQAISDDLKVPLTIVTAKTQDISLTIDEWQHINRDVYLNDMLTGNQYQINDNIGTLQLEKGTHKKRFFLTFEKTTEDNLVDAQQNIKLNYDTSSKSLIIACLNDLEYHSAILLDIIGTKLHSWENTDITQKKNILNLSKQLSGIYVLRIKTNFGVITKKIFIH
jgi:hypothetical protein